MMKYFSENLDKYLLFSNAYFHLHEKILTDQYISEDSLYFSWQPVCQAGLPAVRMGLEAQARC
jgi:hypothetical protein